MQSAKREFGGISKSLSYLCGKLLRKTGLVRAKHLGTYAFRRRLLAKLMSYGSHIKLCRCTCLRQTCSALFYGLGGLVAIQLFLVEIALTPMLWAKRVARFASWLNLLAFP